MLYKNLLSFVDKNYSHRSVNAKDISILSPYFNKNSVISCLKDIINTPELLEKIASRSYLHTLGFYKIVLVDSNSDLSDFDVKTQVRLHLWKPNEESVDFTESLHEHSFDFVSHVISGKIENQSFYKNRISPFEKVMVGKVKSVIDKFFQNNSIVISRTENILEDIFKSEIAKKSPNVKNSSLPSLAPALLSNISNSTGLSFDKLSALAFVFGFYQSDRISGNIKSYKHILKDYYTLPIASVAEISEGQSYFHSYEFPHRLSYDSNYFNGTILLTSHIPENPEGGSFQRPTFNVGEEKDYTKKKVSKEELYQLLNEYIEFVSGMS